LGEDFVDIYFEKIIAWTIKPDFNTKLDKKIIFVFFFQDIRSILYYSKGYIATRLAFYMI